MKKILLFLGILFAAIIFVVFWSENNSRKINIPIENQQIMQPDTQNKTWPESILEMSKKEFQGTDLKLEKIITQNNLYTRHYITYKSEGLKISGAMNIPIGEGPFPIVIINHGYIEPAAYRIGQGGMQREQDFFARNGYVTFYSDYRGYGNSDGDPYNDVRPRTGYVEDVLNGISALKKSELSFLNREKIFMLGHSLGGGIALNVMVTKPNSAQAYALLAPINADYKKNYDRWVANDFSETAKTFLETYGTYEENPEFWKSISANNYFDKITRPLIIHQGLLDPDVPVQWSRDLANELKSQGKDVSYFEYPSEGHVFYVSQNIFMRRTLDFFNKNL